MLQTASSTARPSRLQLRIIILHTVGRRERVAVCARRPRMSTEGAHLVDPEVVDHHEERPVLDPAGELDIALCI